MTNDVGEEGFEKASKLRSEFVVAVTGKVTMHETGAVNESLATGEIEVRANQTTNFIRIRDTSVPD